MFRFASFPAIVGLLTTWGIIVAGVPLSVLGQGPSRAVAKKPAPPPALSPELKAFADECEGLRRGTILRLEDSLRGLKSGHVVTSDNAGTIRRTEADLEALRTGRRMVVPMLRFPTRAGQIGRLPGGGAFVEQVLGPKEALVRCSFRVNVVVTRDRRPVGEIVQQRPLFKMRGQTTDQWSESTEVAIDGAFQVVGTERYRTEDGRWATVQVLQPFDMRPIEEYLRREGAK
jgi:hypothetical protein